MKLQPIALLCKQTHLITSGPDLCDSAIYRDFLFYLFIQILYDDSVFIFQMDRHISRAMLGVTHVSPVAVRSRVWIQVFTYAVSIMAFFTPFSWSKKFWIAN